MLRIPCSSCAERSDSASVSVSGSDVNSALGDNTKEPSSTAFNDDKTLNIN